MKKKKEEEEEEKEKKEKIVVFTRTPLYMTREPEKWETSIRDPRRGAHTEVMRNWPS